MSAESESPVAAREPGRPMPGVREWLNEHWDDYAGEWIALRDGELLGHAVELPDLVRQIGSLRQSGAYIMRLV